MLNQPWNLVFLTGFLIYVVIRGVFIERTKRNEKAHSRVDARDRVLMFLVFLGSLALPLVTSSHGFSRSPTIGCQLSPRGVERW
jgi:hypothetical protein